MTARTYQAETMSEALAEVKRELGPGAVILHTRRVGKGKLRRLLGRRPRWEVTAAADVNVPDAAETGRYVGRERASEMDAAAGSGESPRLRVVNGAGEELPAQVREIRGMLATLLSRGDAPEAEGDALPETLAYWRDRLIEQEVDGTTVDELIGRAREALTSGELEDVDTVRDELAGRIAARIRTAPAPQPASDAPRVMAFIGPTGVGKTTTIAKLAANYHLRDNLKVGLITIDTYRIAAVDQLRTYADIIELPLEVVLTAGELYQAVRSMRDRDVILIDTAGRSQNHRTRIGQLRSFLVAAKADEVHLVMSATSNRRCVMGALERFCPLGVNRIDVTKLDEAGCFGMILNVATAQNASLSYVTTGQDVPDDIRIADGRDLAGLILRGAMEGHADAD